MAAADETRKCAFFVTKRGRNCRMIAARGSVYCGEHMLAGGDATKVVVTRDDREMERERVPCPLDPSHTVYRHLLHKHLKKCNAAKKPILDCYTKNANSGLVSHICSPEEMAPLSTFSPAIIETLISKVEAAYTEHAVKIEQDIRDHPVLLGPMEDPKNGASALKHLKQQASMLGHLQSLGVLVPRTCFIEFGAGKGKLSDVVQRTMAVSDGCHCVLVDRASCRRKAENHHKKMRECASFQRLLIDIEHLDLSKLQCLSEGLYDRTVGIAKHLCGAATDFSLRCLLETLRAGAGAGAGMASGEDLPESKRLCQHPARLEAIVMAVCCHHRCTWASLLGREMLEQLGFSPVDFHLMSHMSSWAVCGVRAEGVEWDHSAEGVAQNCHTHYVPHPKEDIGLKCKRIIDAARVWALRKAGLDAKLVYFVDKNTSLENVLLIATSKGFAQQEPNNKSTV